MSTDEDISTLLTRQKHMREQLEPAAEEFISAGGRFAAEHYRVAIERAVTAQPDLAKAKGVEGLKPLKAGMNELIARAPELAKHHLGAEELWVHLKPQEELDEALDRGEEPRWRYTAHGRRQPDAFDSGTRLLIGEVGALLDEYGFLGEHPSYEQRESGWRYQFGFDWSEDMIQRLAAYAELYAELVKASRELAAARSEKEAGEARDLWESA